MSIIKKSFLNAIGLVLTVMACLNLNANNVDANAARLAANTFLKYHANIRVGSNIAPSLSDIKLAHAEASTTAKDAHAYYVFNIDGGGFVIIAGEDRANPVLGYSDKGRLNFNNMPENLKALLAGYKEEIEYLQLHPELKVTPAVYSSSGTIVAPLIKTNWGQEMPYYLQCPTYQGEYCVVGCVATAMAQVMFYWQYPQSSEAISSYYCYEIGQTIPSLPETNFDYSKMLLSYCHWDWDNSELIQDTYTDAQAQAVAKISRYCGQAVRMDYSPEGSGATVSSQLSAMKKFGYSSSASDVTKSGWWGTYYTTAEWEAMMKAELDEGQPILYSASDDYGAGGHAFICDGYDSNGLFHFNFGWYGTCDGWYVSTALNMTHRDGEDLKFNSYHEMLTGLVPPTYSVISVDSLIASDELLVLGEEFNPQAMNVHIKTTYPYLNFVFSLVKANGKRECNSNSIHVTEDYIQGNNLEGSITLPTTLESGTYDLRLYHHVDLPRNATLVQCPSGKLQVVGYVAKFGKPFDVADVVKLIGYILNEEKPYVSVGDVTKVIAAVLND